MMPILQKIDLQLQSTTREDLRAELLAERITYMARIGQFSESHQLLSELRRRFSDGRYPRVSVWLMIVDGMLGFFERLDPASTDRLLRAHELARAAGYRDLNRTAASWLVMSGFNTGDYDAMARFVERYIDCSTTERDSAACRVAVIVTYAELYAGRHHYARLWFERARQLAVDVGDETAIASIMYGRAAMHNARARLNAVLGRHEDEARQFSTMEVESSESFHRATGQSSLTQCLDLLRARLLFTEQRFGEAAAILGSLVDENVSVSMIGDQIILNAEHAICLFRAGDLGAAAQALDSIDTAGSRKLGCDDRVVFWKYLLELAAGLGRAELGARSAAQLDAAVIQYEAEMAKLLSVLSRLEGPLEAAFAHVPGPKNAATEEVRSHLSDRH